MSRSMRRAGKKKWKFELNEITLLIILAFIIVVVKFYGTEAESEQMAAEKITAILLDDHDVSFASKGIINEEKLNEIKNMNYNEFKKFINVKNDFCIYIEDGHGNIILAKGSYKLNGNAVYCRE